jgi:hypothetical protein
MLVAGLVAVVVVVVGGNLIYRQLTSIKVRNISAPAQLGGYGTIDGPNQQAAKGQAEQSLRSNKGVEHTVVAFYGSDESEFLLGAASGHIQAKAELLDNEGRTLAIAFHGTASPATSSSVDGISVRCVTIQGATNGAVCIHDEKGLIVEGIGFGIGADETAALTAEATHKV